MARSSLLLVFLCGLLSLYTALAKTNEAGVAFLEAKGKEDGVVTLPSGLMYKEVRPGNRNGKAPTNSSPCLVHYTGSLIDGTEFDSSYKRGEPSTFAPRMVIRGLGEAMQLMKEGGKWEFYIPAELAYGEKGVGGSIPPGSALVYDMELLQVTGEDARTARLR